MRRASMGLCLALGACAIAGPPGTRWGDLSPGQRACVAEAERRYLDVREVGPAEPLADASGSATRERTVLTVARAGQVGNLVCTHDAATGESRIEGL